MKQSLLSFFLLILLCHCSTAQKPKTTALQSLINPIGYLSIIQGPTSDKETLINLLVPRLTHYRYEVKNSSGVIQNIQPYSVVAIKDHFFKVDKLHIKNLNPKESYELFVYGDYKGKEILVDQRSFKTLTIQKNDPSFALLSCFSDEWKYNSIIDSIWNRLAEQPVDFLIFSGDVVYVDIPGFLERGKATEKDIWQRYTDSLRRIPFYHSTRLTPVFATWDDHDYGSNDGDRDFISKEASKKIFSALFQGPALTDGTWKPSGYGVSSEYNAFGQRFYFMDDRYFRQPDKNQKTAERYGQWGEKQHQWLLDGMIKTNTPVWIVNGGQINNGKTVDVKEVMQGNHPAEFKLFTEELKQYKNIFVFATGDIHFSEIMKIPTNIFGLSTYEITSSAMHSTRSQGWDNPLRVEGMTTMEYNFMVIKSHAHPQILALDINSIGANGNSYFKGHFEVKR